jgi:excisionase family DNA binding protein
MNYPLSEGGIPGLPVGAAALSLAEFAKAIGVSRTTVWRRISAGDLRVARFGGKVLVPVSEVARILGESA